MSEAKVMEWKIHPEFPFYKVSEFGDVIRLVDRGNKKAGSRVKGTIDIDGYIKYSLFDRNNQLISIFCHRLVLETFVGITEDPYFEARHLNGSRLANHYSNLEWSTRKEKSSRYTNT